MRFLNGKHVVNDVETLPGPDKYNKDAWQDNLKGNLSDTSLMKTYRLSICFLYVL
jgi:hypothetical protein